MPGTKEEHFIPFPAIQTRHVNHGHIHADVPNYGGDPAANENFAPPPSVLPADAIGMPDWEGKPHSITFPGGESMAEFHFRVGQALAPVLEHHRGGVVVIDCVPA